MQLKAKKQGQLKFVCGWVSKGSHSALTMKTALAYDVDEGECLDIQTLHGPVTFQAKECGNTWGFYKGGQEKGKGKEVQATGSGSHSAAASKAPTKSALKPPK